MSEGDASLPECPLDVRGAAGALQIALGQIAFTRDYVNGLLAATPAELWHVIPPGGVSSIAWQVGHLTVAQYGLLLFRQRGRQDIDLELLPGRFRKRYARGSTPVPGHDAQESVEELSERFAAVYAQAMLELPANDPQQLLDPVEMPYAVYANKLGCVLFCPLHEQIHAGQIGLLRRQLGLDPVR